LVLKQRSKIINKWDVVLEVRKWQIFNLHGLQTPMPLTHCRSPSALLLPMQSHLWPLGKFLRVKLPFGGDMTMAGQL